MSWSKSGSKGKSKEKGKTQKENPKVPNVQKVRTMVKPQKIGLFGLENRIQKQVQKLSNMYRRITMTNLTRTIPGLMSAGVSTNGMVP